MGSNTTHDTVARRIAKKRGAEYNKGKGADIHTEKLAVEVETAETVKEAWRQLQGHPKPVYIAGTTKKAVAAALEATEGTTIGVMDEHGNILKPSTRKTKRKKRKR